MGLVWEERAGPSPWPCTCSHSPCVSILLLGTLAKCAQGKSGPDGEMGSVAQADKRRMVIYLPRDLFRHLKIHAFETDRPVSAVVEEAVRALLTRKTGAAGGGKGPAKG